MTGLVPGNCPVVPPLRSQELTSEEPVAGGGGAPAGILGPGHRFQTDAQLAAYAGVAPLEASSAGRVRHRLNRGGNRRLNAILHRMAIAQARSSPAARTYLARREAEGKTRREAIRAPKRFLVRAIWRRWQACVGAAPAQPAALSPAAA